MIDAHVHLYDPAVLDYAWVTGHPVLDARHGPTEYAEAVSSTRAGCVFVEVDCRPDQAVDEVDWVVAAGGPIPVLGIVARAVLDADDVEDQLDRLVERDLVRGVRHLIQGQPSARWLGERFGRGLRAAGARDLTVDLCCTADQLGDVVELVRAVPDARFVLDHAGKPDIGSDRWEPWATDLSELAGCDNIEAVKLSGLLTEAGAPWADRPVRRYLDHAAEVFGADRAMVGSDWPVVETVATLGEWDALVEEWLASLSPSDRAAVTTDTATRVYRL